ncbi:MAG: hypothetical protein UIH18_00475 [Fibrobacteraceae bacterium]|nr:hypothetical protein [Fibrobacteraceae bacterium]
MLAIRRAGVIEFVITRCLLKDNVAICVQMDCFSFSKFAMTRIRLRVARLAQV